MIGTSAEKCGTKLRLASHCSRDGVKLGLLCAEVAFTSNLEKTSFASSGWAKQKAQRLISTSQKILCVLLGLPIDSGSFTDTRSREHRSSSVLVTEPPAAIVYETDYEHFHPNLECIQANKVWSVHNLVPAAKTPHNVNTSIRNLEFTSIQTHSRH